MKDDGKAKCQSDLIERTSYGPGDAPPALESRLGNPGEYPYTRGIHADMYRGRLWTMRQYAGFGSAEESNRRYHYLLSQGTTGLSVAFDLPTQMGRDSDSSHSLGEVGRVGVAISTLDDMEVLLRGLPLEKISISMTINATAPILLAFLLVAAERRGLPWSLLTGTTQNDILKEYIARGTYIYPPRAGLCLAADVIEFCSSQVKHWNTISISGYHMREAGCTAVQEVGFTLANAIAYVEAARARGLGIDEFGPRLAFFFNCHNHFLEEVAKFRAARRLWASLMKDRFGATNPRSLMLRFHTQTAGSTLTAQQPYNNVVRTALQAFAAVCGGTQSLHTNSYDEALGLPTEESALLALRTQQVIAGESGITDVADPLAGSFVVEHLTEKIESEARALIEKIDAMGGMLGAIESGFPQGEIERAAYRYQQKIESGDQRIVGVNFQQSEEPKDVPVLAIDPEIESRQRQRVEGYRNARDADKTRAALEQLGVRVRAGENTMPAIIDAVRAQATLGEISDCLRNIFGEYDLGAS